MSNDILVVAEVAEGNLDKTTHSAVTFARQASGALGSTYSILVLGDAVGDAVAVAATLGAAKVLVAEDPSLRHYLAECYVPTIAECGSKYAVIVGTASAYGKDLLPRVAGRLGSGYASDISELLTDMPDGVCALNAMLYKRPMYAGNVYGLVKIATPNHVVSVRQSAFTAAEPSEAVASIEQVAVAVAGESVNRIEFVSFDRSRAQDLC